MEIVSYVIDGALEHKDSIGNGSVIRPGDVQRMTAGSGIRHSEYNSSPVQDLRFLQIWIQPNVRGIEPSYEQKNFLDTRRENLSLVASPDGDQGSVRLCQDARIYASELGADNTVTHSIAENRHGWLQMIDGAVVANGLALGAGDALALSEELSLSITAKSSAHFLLFDLA